MATDISEMRRNLGVKTKRAQEIRDRLAGGEEPTDELLAELDEAIADAERAARAVDEMNKKSIRFQDLEDFCNSTDWTAPNAAMTAGLSLGGLPGSGAFAPHNDPRNTRGGLHKYSVQRAIQGAVSLRDGGGFSGLEAEVHQHLRAQRGGRVTRGVLIPWDAPVSRDLFPRGWRFRDLTTTTGAGVIPKLIHPEMIDLLRAKLVLSDLGAWVMTGLSSGFGIPRQSAATTGEWVAEGVAGTASNATIDQVELSPRTATANTKLSRKFINQSSIDAENFAINELTATVAQLIERAAINGTGADSEPLGLLQNTDVPTITAIGANGGALTWAKLLEFVGKHGAANAPLDRRAWLINPQTRAKLGGTARESGYPKYLYDFDDPASPIAGFPYAESTNMPSNLTKGSGTGLSAVLFGAWSELIISMFGALDVLVDPYTESTAGNVRVSVFQDADVNVRHPESFVKCTEVSTAA